MRRTLTAITIAAAAALGLLGATNPADATPSSAPTHCVTRAYPGHPHTYQQVCWGRRVFTRTILRGTTTGTVAFVQFIPRGVSSGTQTGTTTITR